MIKKRLLLLLWGIYFPLSAIFSQTVHNQWYHFAPNDRMNDMARVDDNLWVHTEDGIVKFDVATRAISFFDVTDPRLNSNQVHGLSRLKSGDGIVVVTYDFGLLSIEGTDWKYYDTTNSSLPAYDPVNIAPAPDSTAWVITRSSPAIINVTNRADAMQWRVEPLPIDSSGIDLGVNLTVDSDGNVWVGTESRLLRFDPTIVPTDSGWTDYTDSLMADGVTLDGVDFVYKDRSGRLWLNTQGKIYQNDGNGWALLVDNFGEIDICEDDLDGIWVTSNQGPVHKLYKYENDTLIVKNSSNSNLPSDFYSSVYRDTKDGVWMGGNPGQLTWFRNGIWDGFDLKNDVISDRVNLDVERGRNNFIWILSKDSVQLTNASKTAWRTIVLPPDVSGEKIIPIRSHGSEFFYLLSDYENQNMVSIYQNKQWTVFDTTHGFVPGTEIIDMAVDTMDRFWVLARNALYLQNGNTWTRFTSDTLNMPIGTYEAIVSDNTGKVWIITEKGASIFSFDGQTFSVETAIPSIWPGTNSKVKLHCANNNDIYIYADSGAFKFSNGFLNPLNFGIEAVYELKAIDDTLVITNDEGMWFWANNQMVRSVTPWNSLMRFGKPGPFEMDFWGNYWIGNREETTGALSLYNSLEVVYPNFLESIEELSIDNWNISAYPNPLGDEVNISVELEKPVATVGRLLDLNGRIIWQEEFSISNQVETALDLSKQPPGIYIFQISDGVQQRAQKLIKY
jgi:ligand-binding sensor domain-containing protein